MDIGTVAQVVFNLPTGKRKASAAGFAATGLGFTAEAILASVEALDQARKVDQAMKGASEALGKARLAKSLVAILDALPQGTFLRYHEGSLGVVELDSVQRQAGAKTGIRLEVVSFDGHRLVRDGDYVGCGSRNGFKAQYRLGYLVQTGGIEEATREPGKVDEALASSIRKLPGAERGAASWVMSLVTEAGGLHKLYQQEGIEYVGGRRVKLPGTEARFAFCKAAQYLARDLKPGHKYKTALEALVARFA
jgi:hypothetical protein